MKSFLTITALLICIVSFSQKRDTVLITPGHQLLQSDKLRDYNISYDFFRLENGKEIKIGSLVDNLTILFKENKKCLLRVCNISFGSNLILDSGLCYAKGLVPIYHRSVQTKKNITLNFNNEIVSGVVEDKVKPDQGLIQINHKSQVSLFDSYYEDIIAKSLKLKEGFVFKFPEYIYERGGTVWSTGEIAKKEMLSTGAGKSTPVWTIIFYEKGSNGEITRTTTYKIEEHERKIISREYKTSTARILMKEQV